MTTLQAVELGVLGPLQVRQGGTPCLAGDQWAEMAGLLAQDTVNDDRRRVVGSGAQQDRDLNIANMRATRDLGIKNATSTVIATRGQRLVLSRVRYSGRDDSPESFHSEILRVLEIDVDGRITARVFFDSEDLDAAYEELDARYLAGEAAGNEVWAEITQSYAAMNRHEMPPTRSNWVTVDHRVRGWFDGGDLAAYARSPWDGMPDVTSRVETVHRLTSNGAVATHVACGTAQDGSEAEWRIIVIFVTREGGPNRCELFNEADFDSALARFDELQAQAQRPGNTASQVAERFPMHFTAGDWKAMAEILARDISIEDRRRGVNAGIRHGREAALADMRAATGAGLANATSTVIATRGERLALMLVHTAERGQRSEAFEVDVLHVLEVNTESEVVAVVVFEPNDIDAAFTELDARYAAELDPLSGSRS